MLFASEENDNFEYRPEVSDNSGPQVLTVVVDGEVLEFYQGSSLTASTPHVPTAPWAFNAIGRAPNRLLRGGIYEIMLWPRVLEMAERTVVWDALETYYAF